MYDTIKAVLVPQKLKPYIKDKKTKTEGEFLK